MKKKIVVLLLAICSCVLLLFGACLFEGKQIEVYDANTGELLYDKKNNEITVEYGDMLVFRQNMTYKGKKVTGDAKLFDPSGNEVKMTYGTYTFDKLVGEYTVRYFLLDGDATLDVKVHCQDTVMPTIKVLDYVLYGIEGERISIPRCTFSDVAGIDESSVVYTVTSPSGETSVATDSFVLTESGYYTLKVSVKDKNGNESSTTLKTQCLNAYVDANRERAIYTFDNEEYLNLTVNMDGSDNITREIVTSGYPTLPNDSDANGVLKMTSDKVYGDVDTVFLLHEDLIASTGYRIVIRFAVSKDTDYVKVFREKALYSYKGNEQQIVSQVLGVKANTWYNLEINPLDFGYNLSFKDFIIAYRDVGGLEMYIDEIYFVQPEFEDVDWSATNLADFDEEEYLDHVYQNMYNNPATTRAFRVSGTKFEILTEEDEKWSTYDLDGAKGGVLYAKTAAKYGGMTYMFPQVINLDEIVAINVRMLNIDKYNGMIFGFFDGDGLDGGNTKWYQYTSDEYAFNKWHDITISVSHLRDFTSDGEISGFFLQMTMGTTLSYEYEIEFCIDEITAIYKNDTTEQVDLQIADFEQNSTVNAFQFGSVNSNKVVGESTFEIAEGKGVNGSNALKISSNEKVFGVRYIFDEKVALKDGQSLNFDVAIEGNGTITSIIPELRTVSGISLVGSSIPASSFVANTYLTGGFAESELVMAGLVACYELRLKIVASSVSENNIVYLDNIRIYDPSDDKTAPIVTVENTNGVTLVGNEKYQKAKFAHLNYSVTDEDPFASISVVSVKDGFGAEVAFDQEGFVPTANGDYTVTLQATDEAGNLSESVTATYSITVCEDEKEYANSIYTFNFSNSKDLISFVGSWAQNSLSSTKYADGKLTNINISTTSGSYSALVIDLGGFYQVKDIENVTVNITVDVPQTNSWLDAYLNHAATIEANAKTTRPEVKNSSYKTAVMTKTGSISFVIDKASILLDANFTEDTVLNTLTLGFASASKAAVISIDSIEFSTGLTTTDLAQKLQFNSSNSTSIVTGGKNTTIASGSYTSGDTTVEFTGLQSTVNSGTYASAGEELLAISLGDFYKVSQIESITIELTATLISSSTGNLGVYLNDGYVYDESKHYMTGTGHFQNINITSKTPLKYTVTITQEKIKSVLVNNETVFNDDTVLSRLVFGWRAQPRSAEINIDSIEIVLK